MTTFQTKDIQMRDPFVLPVAEEGLYYLFGTTDKDAWHGPFVGFDCYRSRDLKNWEGPLPAFRPRADFWGKGHFWAPEVHAYRGRYYMFASFTAPQAHRGTQILTAARPEGPYESWSDGPVTPRHWECLDGTLFVDEQGDPWMIFCHEFNQIHDGSMCAIRLSSDLKAPAGRPVFLFNASEGPWVGPFKAAGLPKSSFPFYVTDGPFLHRTASGALLMLWSSYADQGYAMALARSASGTILGPWIHEEKPLWEKDGGHGMIFRAFDGRLHVTLHTPNDTPNERPLFVPIIEKGDNLVLLPDGA